MHILFLTDNFPPEVNAPASRTFEHCREWVRAGHQVTAITCFPNFPRGKVYTGYRNRPWKTEWMDGIRVVRVWSYITANEGLVRRILDYVSFMTSAVLASPLVPRPDVVVGTSPQFFTACGAWAVSRMRGAPFVFELRDLWPESIKAVGAMKHGGIIGLLEKVELFLYRRAARIVSVTESFRKTLARRGIDEGKIRVVTNGVDTSRFRPLPRDPELARRYGLEGKFTAGYVGTHGMAHALETILEAADAIRRAPGGDAFRFILLGNGARKQALMERAGKLALDNVIFIDTVPKEEVARYWSLLDVSIIHLRRTDLFTTVIPSKLFECMGMGLPVLHGVAGESAEIVQREGVGLVFEPENARDLREKLMKLKADDSLRESFRSRCLEAAGSYDRRDLAGRMLGILKAIPGNEEPAAAIHPALELSSPGSFPLTAP
jgi:hypothetical protein